MTWCIDAWAVSDGLAFISEREPGNEHATITVHVGPPWFDCTPIASRATALWATRGHFEEGFFYENEEVGFNDLEAAIEAVRRAYLASGHGEPSGGAVPTTPPLTPNGRGGAGSQSSTPDLWSPVRKTLSSISSDEDRKTVATSLRALFDETLQPDGAVMELLRDTLEDMRAHMVDEKRPSTFDRIGESVRLQHWLSALFRAGFRWRDLPTGMEAMIASWDPDAPAGQQPPEGIETHVPDDKPDVPAWQPRQNIGTQHLADIIFLTPLPWRMRRGRFATFGDILSVVGSDRLFLETELEFEHVAAILLIAKLTAAAAASASFVGLRPDSAVMALADDVLTSASEWIAEMLPDTRLAGHPAEHLVARLWKKGGGTQEPAPLSPEPKSPSPRTGVTLGSRAGHRTPQSEEA